MKKILVLLLLVCPFIISCDSGKSGSTDSTSHLGDIQHEFVIDGPARTDFDRGLLLLHSFEYDDAREAFIEAKKASPDELMVYWGEAMTHYKALWGLQDVEAGRAVIAEVGATPEERLAKAGDGLERGFWQGIEILYGEGELQERNIAYAEHMAQMYADYETNQEVAAFYALGLMWSSGSDGDNSLQIKSAEIAQGILEENPNHPGALHYVIHAYDDPKTADLAQSAANKYSKVAPDATHALHMPSHIYLAMGMWNEVVASNETSYAASVKRMESKGLDDGARGYHSYAWLHYGYLQQGRFDEAKQLLKDMYVYEPRASTTSARTYLLMMQSFQLVETGSLPDRNLPDPVQTYDLGLESKATHHFLNAMLARDMGDVTRIDQEIDTLEIHIEAAELIVTDDGVSLCSAGPTRYAPNKNSITRARVMVEEMKAMIAMVNGDKALIEDHLLAAVELEESLGAPVGPPDITYPSYDMLGNWLLDEGRPEEALVKFDQGLAKAPNRRMSLMGKEKALRMLGRSEEADKVAELLATFIVPTPLS